MADERAKTKGVVMSERAFREDPAKAVREAKSAPHVVVAGANGQARMIVRQREALKLT